MNIHEYVRMRIEGIKKELEYEKKYLERYERELKEWDKYVEKRMKEAREELDKQFDLSERDKQELWNGLFDSLCDSNDLPEKISRQKEVIQNLENDLIIFTHYGE